MIYHKDVYMLRCFYTTAGPDFAGNLSIERTMKLQYYVCQICWTKHFSCAATGRGEVLYNIISREIYRRAQHIIKEPQNSNMVLK